MEQVEISEKEEQQENPLAAAQKPSPLPPLHEAEKTARSDFSEGLRNFEQGLRKKAMVSFEKPLLMNIAWLARHKHMFSEFGVTLRKIKIFGLAMRYHSKALSLSPNESNILFNIARVYICLGDNEAAEKCLRTVLQTKPKLKEAVLLQKHIDKIRQTRKR